ncbi:MAG: hypothetical protein GTO18_19695 [Anaerolineales bacterium]|nr:hypothetical protein [Anaerolineales bacterium]
MRLLILSLLFLLLTLACRTVTGLFASPTPQPTSTATYTAIPPTVTPIPSLTPPPTVTPFPTLEVDIDDLESQAAGLLPDFESDLLLDEDITRYWIEVDVEFDPEGQRASIDGIARILFTNQIEEPLDDLVLMLWPNDDQYRSEMTAGPVQINGRTVESSMEYDGLVTRVPLLPKLNPGELADISVPFHVDAFGPIGDIVPKRFGITEGVFVAPTFYPLIPRWVDGTWQAAPAPSAGDTTNSDTALYHVTITSQSEYRLATSGVEVDVVENGDGTTTRTFTSGPMRDFAFAIGSFIRGTREVAGIELVAWVMPDHESDIEAVLEAAAIQLSFLNYIVGAYPYPELDLVDAPGAFGGIEYPGLVFLGTLGGPNIVDPVIHEVAHQWFYALIGNDQLREPWLDEATASYWQLIYFERYLGKGRAASELSQFRSWVSRLDDSTIPIGLAVEDYESEYEYAVIVYIKGALFFDELRSYLGDEGFFEFLAAYFETFRYGFASAQDFQAHAELTCGCDLDDVFNLWVFEGGEVLVP